VRKSDADEVAELNSKAWFNPVPLSNATAINIDQIAFRPSRQDGAGQAAIAVSNATRAALFQARNQAGMAGVPRSPN
jgi:hypothetical protein